MFIENFKNFIENYGQERKLKLVGFSFLSFIAGCLEFLGVALVYPFVILIIKPDAIFLSKYININNSLSNGLIVGLGVFLIFIIKNIYIIFTQYVQNKFVVNWKNDIKIRFMKALLYSDYKQTMKTSQNDKLYTIGTLCDYSIDNFIMRILNLLTNIVIIVMLIFLLMIKFFVPAVISIVFVTTSIILQNKFFKSKTLKISEVLSRKSYLYQKSLLENVNNLKEIKLLSSEQEFCNNFIKSSTDLKKVEILNGFYASIPPYMVEILIVASLLVMAYILTIKNVGNTELIASFAIITAALFRIAPALNRIQSAIIAINASRTFVKQINKEYKNYDFSKISTFNIKNSENLKFENTIEFKNVCFSYNNTKQILKNITLDIKKGDFIGIIGLSGAGKSTLVDVLTGLLPIDSGEIKLDGIKLDENKFKDFRKLIGYVPQQINVLDRSIRENVAWGCKEIDDEKVINALKSASLYNVIREYPEGIYSNILVGSNGLSQGQKQRLAIARAFYKDFEILILDEATSALDVKIESEITESLLKIAKNKTIIAIAHRLSTLKACNKLVYIDSGKVIDTGTFDELSEKYEEFGNLIKLSKLDK